MESTIMQLLAFFADFAERAGYSLSREGFKLIVGRHEADESMVAISCSRKGREALAIFVSLVLLDIFVYLILCFIYVIDVTIDFVSVRFPSH